MSTTVPYSVRVEAMRGTAGGRLELTRVEKYRKRIADATKALERVVLENPQNAAKSAEYANVQKLVTRMTKFKTRDRSLKFDAYRMQFERMAASPNYADALWLVERMSKNCIAMQDDPSYPEKRVDAARQTVRACARRLASILQADASIVAVDPFRDIGKGLWVSRNYTLFRKTPYHRHVDTWHMGADEFAAELREARERGWRERVVALANAASVFYPRETKCEAADAGVEAAASILESGDYDRPYFEACYKKFANEKRYLCSSGKRRMPSAR